MTMAIAPFQEFATHYRPRINNYLQSILPNAQDDPRAISQAIHYMVLGPGKRIRPLLVYAAGSAAGANLHDLDKIAASVELIHIYSLIHDDLPAMDNDELRHGKPSCHVAFNEAIAILCGDALQSLAFELLSAEFAAVSATTQLKLVNILARAIGSGGMVAGQVMDMLAQGKRIDQAALERIHRHKTGALISSAVYLGALAGDLAAPSLCALQQFADYLGLLFQIKDDILDIEGSTEKLGKRQGADLALQKATYPSIIGMDNTKYLLREYHAKAIAALDAAAIGNDYLRQVADFIVERDY